MVAKATRTTLDNANQNSDALVVSANIKNILRLNGIPITKAIVLHCSNNCGYFDWAKNEVLDEESNSVNHTLNHVPNEKDEELPILFDELARISEK